jgi:hypothetical protein
MTYQLWDKISPIYDITAEQAMINNPLYGSENSYLILRDDDSILDILPISTLRELTGKDATATDEEVCEAYIAKLTAPPPAPPSGGDVSALSAKVASLEEQLAAAKILLGVE